jgi:hypothetical protein
MFAEHFCLSRIIPCSCSLAAQFGVNVAGLKRGWIVRSTFFWLIRMIVFDSWFAAVGRGWLVGWQRG